MNDARIPGDQARASVLVEVEPEAAFRVFTEQIDAWWLRGLRYRVAGTRRGFLHMEGHVGGRLFESFDSEEGTRVVETGRVLAWEPPRRLLFAWRAVNFAPHESTEVEVSFEPTRRGTLVTVTHRGWAAIGPDHPVRHGLPNGPFLGNMAMWWGALLNGLREYAAG